LKGVIHCAAVLEDGVLANQDWTRFARVMAPKADGAWLLHALTRDKELDFFVMFSSIASVFGSRGQGNYTAANSFLDALAHYRRVQGFPALSVNWGAWMKVGLAARGHVDERLTGMGVGAFSPEEGLRVLSLLLRNGATQVAVIPVDWSKFLRQFDKGAEPPLLRNLASSLRTDHGQLPIRKTDHLLEQLEAAAPARRRSLLYSYVEKQAAKVLGLPPGHLVEADRPLHEMGLDSLMAVELRNSLSASLERHLPATVLFDYPTLNLLTAYLGREVLRWDFVLDSAGGDNGQPHVADDDLVGRIEQLSDEDVERLYRE
jgi:hypothetical protein